MPVEIRFWLTSRSCGPDCRKWPEPHSSTSSELFLVFQIVPVGHLWAQVPGTAGHDHLTEVACVDVPPGEKRPEFGCFNVGTVTGLHFSQASVYWHLHAFPSRKAADAARSATGIVVEEDGRVWLSEFGPQNKPRAEVKLSPSSDRCSFPQQRATLRCSLTRRRGPATIRG